jgi:Fe-S cluster assembly ATPase SufC
MRRELGGYPFGTSVLMLKIENLHAEIDGKPILKGLTLTVNVGEVQKLLGISLEGSVG